MSDFSESCKTYSSSQLKQIAESADEYQKAAIDAAKCELVNRQLKDLKMHLAEDERRMQHIEQKLKERKQQKPQYTAERLKSAPWSNVNVMSLYTISNEKLMLIISIVSCVLLFSVLL